MNGYKKSQEGKIEGIFSPRNKHATIVKGEDEINCINSSGHITAFPDFTAYTFKGAQV
jgi:hypothetical protein